MRRCRFSIGLHGNSSAGSPPPNVARHRHRGKDNHGTLAMLEDWRSPPSGNSASARQNFGHAVCKVGRRKCLPEQLATPLAENKRQLGLSRLLGSGCPAPHLREFSYKALRRPPAPASKYGTSRHRATALPLRKYVRNLLRRSRLLLQLILKTKHFVKHSLHFVGLSST